MSMNGTRREFCQKLSGTACLLAFSRNLSSFPDQNLLTNPAYATGATFRLSQFIKRGADPQKAESIFRNLTDLEPQKWADAWTQLAIPCESQAEEFARQGSAQNAREAYEKASMYYGIAKFPVLNHPAKQAAYRKCVETYLKAAKYFDPPLERVSIPFEGRELIGYLRLPRGISRPPVVIATGGIDVYKEERDTTDLLDAGLASFSMDMPGNGESPLWYTTDADRFYSKAIDYLATRKDVDANRLGILGRSYGGYWAAKMAYVESKRIRAAIQWGGPIHYTFQEPWQQHLKEEKLYLWPFLDSMVYAHHVKNTEELRTNAPTLSLKTQGWLDKPCAPLLALNGAKDPWITIEDVHILLETGQPKTARIFPNDGHMGATPDAGQFAMSWLKSLLQK